MKSARNILAFPPRRAGLVKPRRREELAFLPAALEIVETPPSPVGRAIGFTIIARGWSSFAGLATMALITRFLSGTEQGFYYTFYSLVAIQIVFELGFSTVILQTASHEAAHLTIHPDGSITGPQRERARLASVLQKSVLWYTIAAVAMVLALIPTGFHFFRANTTHILAQHIHWGWPWALVVLASAFTFQIDPLFSFLEGCGYVPQVARTRLHQAILGTVLGWLALVFHRGLFAPGLMIAGQALAGAWFVFHKRHLLLPLLRLQTGDHRIDWGSEIWPFQWRIAVSWMAGYITTQLFNPILFKCRSANEAGQMGLALSICGTLTSFSIAWMNTKAAPFGRMIARKEYRELDRVFRAALWQSTGACLIACTGVWLIVVWMGHHGMALAGRLLPPVPMAFLFVWTVANVVVFAEAMYLRAHKQEKFMVNSIMGAVYIAPVAFLVGRNPGPHGGAWGISAANAIGAIVIGLGYGTYTFLKWRRIWHAS